jgi:hypothetical protein
MVPLLKNAWQISGQNPGESAGLPDLGRTGNSPPPPRYSNSPLSLVQNTLLFTRLFQKCWRQMPKEKKVAGKAWVGGWVLVGLRVQDWRTPGGEEGVAGRRGEGGAAPRRMEKCELVIAKIEEKRLRRKSFIQKALQSLLWAVVGTFEALFCFNKH